MACVLGLIDVEAGDAEAGSRELNGERQADIAEADDADPGLPGPDAIEDAGRRNGDCVHGIKPSFFDVAVGPHARGHACFYSTVTLLARLRG
jgi:hypothetical protein